MDKKHKETGGAPKGRGAAVRQPPKPRETEIWKIQVL
jgi:hypothetical protein